MIYAFNFTGGRDLDIASLMRRTLKKYCKQLASVESINMDGTGWGNGASWESAMMKLNALRAVVKKGITDTDYILSVDSDVIFCTPEVFTHIHTYGIIGIQQGGKPTNTYIGRLSHMSGCSVYLRGDIAKKICAISQDRLDIIRQQFKMYILAEQEDVVISYLAKYVEAEFYALPEHLYSGDLEQDYINKTARSFYHYNFHQRDFFGEHIHKWEVARVLESKGITL